MTNTLSNFKNVHKGKSVIVCGCGTSAAIMKDHYEDIITIGVNDIPKLFTPTYLVVTDHPVRFAPPRRKLVMESSVSESMVRPTSIQNFFWSGLYCMIIIFRLTTTSFHEILQVYLFPFLERSARARKIDPIDYYPAQKK